MEAPPGIGPGMRVLQTRALPLGYGAGWNCLYIIAEEMTFVKRFFRDFQKIFRRSAGLSCAQEKRECGGKAEQCRGTGENCGGDTQPPGGGAEIQHGKKNGKGTENPCGNGKQHQEERHHNACCRRADGFVGVAACLTQTRQFGAGYQREYGADQSQYEKEQGEDKKHFVFSEHGDSSFRPGGGSCFQYSRCAAFCQGEKGRRPPFFGCNVF